MPPTILVVGSLHYDIMVEADHLPRRDETAVGTRWYPKFGGKGGNQAVAVARAGGQARLVGATGKDDFGAFLRVRLSEAGVDATHVDTIPAVGSGMSVAIVDAAGDYAATIVSGANLEIDPARLDGEGIWNGVAMLVLQNEVPEAVNLSAARNAKKRSIPVLLNAAPARELGAELAALVDVLVVNRVEAEMMGTAPVKDLDTAATAAALLGETFRSVVVTAGADGLAAVEGQGGPFALPADPVDVVSTHGAGDCFTGVLATALAQGGSLPTACAAASRAAARHVAGAAT